jgi:hypothetical protein
MALQVFEILGRLGLDDGSSRVRFHEYFPPLSSLSCLGQSTAFPWFYMRAIWQVP